MRARRDRALPPSARAPADEKGLLLDAEAFPGRLLGALGVLDDRVVHLALVGHLRLEVLLDAVPDRARRDGGGTQHPVESVGTARREIFCPWLLGLLLD